MDKDSPEFKKYRREIARVHRQEHPEKKMARKAGEQLPKKPCVLCAREGIQNMLVEAHHDDYHKPWTVDWLCKTHHEEVDTAKDKGGSPPCPVCKHTLHPEPNADLYYCLRCKRLFERKEIVDTEHSIL